MSLPEVYAQQVIKALRISCIEDLYLTNEIAWQRGALVLEEALTGAEARLIISYPKSMITVSTNIGDLNRRRFGATHEIGHLEMHKHRCTVFNCSKGDLDSGGMKEHTSPSLENEANEFASNLLMPDQFFSPLTKDTDLDLSIISELSHRFRVSLTAAALRFIRISKEPLALVVSSSSHIRWFDANDDFLKLGLFVDVGKPLSRETIAIRAFQGASIPEKPHQVPLRAWTRPGHYHPKATLSEQSLAMPKYASVLSLLWINEVIDGDDWDY
jgi:Zn-dependent peptidase ImmA (M78 family)